MSSSSRYVKLVEFAAHAGDVRCVRIGRKTAGVLVTGGDDKKVNVWAIGKTTASFSLTGHQSSVESVSFDNDEMVVAAGGSNGSIKVFELQSGRVTKSLSGHRSNVMCLAWHPYDSTIISGSMDTNVKLWNLRDKEAIMTFKGHNAGVTHVRYSPDGYWVASASSDGAVKLPRQTCSLSNGLHFPAPLAMMRAIKIWDVRGNRLVTDLCAPTKYEITGLEFSPTEYLLATSARDKVVRFWDLETFTNFEQTAPEATPVRNIAFHSDGKYIFSAVQDGCKVWSVEPAVQHDYVDVPWYRVSDLTVNTHRGSQRLIGCSFNSTMVGLFYITLRNVRPFNEDPDFMAREQQAASVDGNPYSGVGASRSNLAAVAAAAQLPPEGAMRRVNLSDSAASAAQNGGGRPSSGGIGMGQQPGSSSRAHDRGAGSSSAGRLHSSGQAAPAQPLLPPVSLYGPTGSSGSGSNRYSGVSAAAASQDFAGPGDSGALDQGLAARAASGQAAGVRPPMVSVGVGVGDSLMRGQLESAPELARVQQQQQPPRQRPYNDRQARDSPADIPQYPRMHQPQPRMESPPDPRSGADQRYSWQTGAAQGGPAAGHSGMDRRGGGGYNDNGAGGAQYASAVPSDLEAAGALQSKHAMFSSAMKKRAHALSLVRNFVAKADWRGAISCARRCDENAVFADLLAAMYERRDAFNLDLVGEVVSVVETVLSLPSDRQVQVGLDVITLHVRFFGPIIRELCSPAARGVGIDLSFEERRERANKAKLSLQNLVPRLNKLGKQSESLGFRAQELASQLAQL
ncbi:microtubule severing protein katanin p80 subunit [Volvox carteri f. nagariensis]|uniref:Katanin p80 WD40 repeat-containing subunit B1 homolog n=1 Tax=Volvox carteri f. nagariensis TaxID=3068 RepID=D8U644_VOLCA|nr:microtubule severing protein katanin p80 subunit [Volvox carteri f. nagariensis]EFJ44875.1 microtubule severing protein katanin p80 subunit [Volvox carteri f. nagariensis]|eukprot:XP_002954158.1 microtubule severing protein katanin p80 subunit [Volvox carteri f. nagariensis]